LTDEVSIDLAKLIGANCTLVISHQQNMVGRTYASIDAVSKPTKRLVASGGYDPAMARQRIAEWKAKEGTTGPQTMGAGGGVRSGTYGSNGTNVAPRQPLNPVAAAFPQEQVKPTSGSAPKSGAPVAAPAATADFDPEVGF
jgi:hypothetical protein